MGVLRASLIVALALAACESTPTVRTDRDPQADFTGYRTYEWVYRAPPTGMNPLQYQRIHDSIDRHLAAKGFTQGQPGDFAVAFTVGARDKVEVTDFGPYGVGYGRYGYYGWGYSNVDVRNITEGTLAIDIYDVESKQPVWHGNATQNIGSQGASPELVEGAVAAILAEFPPA